MSQSRKIEVIRKYIDYYNRFDVMGMLSLMTDDVRFENISDGKINASATGKSELEILARQACDLFKEREQKVLDLVENEEQIAVEIAYSAVLAQDLPNGIVAGERLELKGKSTFSFEGNMIYRIVDES